jgi:hypothetical protein
VASDLPAYVDVHGEDITFDHFERLPTSGLNDEYGLTVAAWLNVTANNVGDQSVFQARTSTGGHGAPHFQLQGNGRLRMTFRNQNGGNVVDAPQVFVDGTEDSGEAYPVDEWFHYAGTYDAFDNEWAMYSNGVPIATGTGPGEDLGDWGGLDTDLFAAGFGAVYDSGGRRLDGLMDELYVFNRALTADEIGVLVDVSPVILGGDFNNDGVADAADLDLLGADAAAGTNTSLYDLNGDSLVNDADRDVFLSGDIITSGNKLNGDADFSGDVQFSDFVILADNFGMPGIWSEGDFDVSGDVQFPDFVILANNFGLSAAAAAAVPEPSGIMALVVGGLLCGWAKRRGRPRR